MNPFLIGKYVSPETFCDRDDETRRLISAIDNGRNVTLYSLRRIGKTGLLFHVRHKLRHRKHLKVIYCDILSTGNLHQFIKVLSEQVFFVLESTQEKVLRTITGVLFNLRPKLTFDKLTGQPEISVDVGSYDDAVNSIHRLFQYLRQKSKDFSMVIMIDEFQRVADYEDKNIEALLRSEIQQLHNAVFVFSGSETRTLFSMFGDTRRPFYQSTELFHLRKISRSDYHQFIKTSFSEGGVRITDENIKLILDWTRNHTYYVQYVCNKLYESNQRNITEELIRKTFYEILTENENSYINYRTLLPEQQWNLLEALSKETGVKEPMGKSFISKHRLGSAATVRVSLNSLLQKEMICREEDAYYVYDVFFARWLERL